MQTAPEVIDRGEQPYVAVRAKLPMAKLGSLADRYPDVFAWIGAHGLVPAGAPFFRYLVIDMAGALEVEAGVPVAAPAEADGDVVAGVLPSGRYASLIYTGHPQELMEPTGFLLDWGDSQGLAWDRSPDDDGERWGSRLEIYLTDPSVEPDMTKWETQLAFRLAD